MTVVSVFHTMNSRSKWFYQKEIHQRFNINSKIPEHHYKLNPASMVQLYDEVQQLYTHLDMLKKPRKSDRVKANKIYLRNTLLNGLKVKEKEAKMGDGRFFLARSYGSLSKSSHEGHKPGSFQSSQQLFLTRNVSLSQGSLFGEVRLRANSIVRHPKAGIRSFDPYLPF